MAIEPCEIPMATRVVLYCICIHTLPSINDKSTHSHTPLALSLSHSAIIVSQHTGKKGSLIFAQSLMEDHKERNAAWVSVPQFGDWDQKGVIPDYSMDFSKIREMRKQKKRDPSRTNEEELIPSTRSSTSAPLHTYHHHPHSPTGRRTFFSYFNCCVKA